MIKLTDIINEKWSQKYKRSIDCNNPKGFSQKAHCQGRKKNELVEEALELFLEKNCPTDPEKWSASKAAAKRKFDVYPSAYANGWAAKNYKSYKHHLTNFVPKMKMSKYILHNQRLHPILL